MTRSRIHAPEKILLCAWFAIQLVLGAFLVHDYGMSIDEPNNQRYAADTLAAYPSLFGTFFEPRYDSSYDGHGPAFVTLAAIVVQVVVSLFPGAFAPDIWHYAYFVTFQLTGLCMYWLARRWFSTWTAWAILILFSTQPLLWGHAFINPKDIPFMFFFTLSVVAGFRLVDGMEGKESFASLEAPAARLADTFRRADPQRRRKFITCVALALWIVLLAILFSRTMDAGIERAVAFFYHAEPDSWMGRIFSSIASPNPSASVENYVTKALKLLHRAERGILIAGTVLLLIDFALIVHDTTLPGVLQRAWKRRFSPGASITKIARSRTPALHPNTVRTWLLELIKSFRDPRLLLAAIALGLATGVRAVAPWAGVIVVLYLFARVRSKAWTAAIAYFVVAGVVTYLAWPRLWEAPVRHYLDALGMISNFPHFPGQVLFDGQFYGPADLPGSYLPVLLNIQLTEPVLLCVYVGFGLFARQILSRSLRTDLLLYIGLGFAAPLLGLIALNSPLYHNFRQTLFLIPALFMLAAAGMEAILARIPQSWIRLSLIILLAVPGVHAVFKLHPYEYVYYNALVGGTAGAYNRYELDYWRISLREVALELNEIAPEGAIVVVTRSAGLLSRYARPDLRVDKTIDSVLNLSSGYDYLVQVARWERWKQFPDVPDVVVIERDGAVLATAKDVKDLTGK